MSYTELSNIAEIIMGQSPSSEFYNEKGEGVPFFQGKADFTDKYPFARKWCSFPTKIAEPGDILISVRAPVGPTNLCNVKSCIGRGLAAIRCKKGKYNNNLLWFYLRYIEKQIAKKGVGSTFKAIGREELSKILVPNIDFAKQAEIISILDRIESAKTKRKEANKLMDGFLKSVFSDMFGNPINNPKHSEEDTLKNLCVVESGGTPKTDKKEYWEGGTIPWLGSTVCKDKFIMEAKGYITEEGLRNSSAKLFKKGTILIALVGATIGKTGFLTFEATTNQNIAGIYPIKIKRITPEYLFFCIQSLYPQFLALSSKGFKMANLSFLRSLKIPIPPIDMQDKFTQIVETVNTLKEKQNKSSYELNDFFNSSIQKYFSRVI